MCRDRIADLNRRKINKVVFLLLERYHESHGFGCFPWIREGTSTPYYTFHCIPVLGREGRSVHPADATYRASLTIYQDHAGLPAWDADEQLWHPEWEARELGSDEMLDWYEEHMGFQEYAAHHADVTTEWRDGYAAGAAGRHLLTWQVMGMVSSALGAVLSADVDLTDGTGPAGTITVWCDCFSFRLDATANHGEVNLWERHVAGATPRELAQELVDRVGGPRPIGQPLDRASHPSWWTM